MMTPARARRVLDLDADVTWADVRQSYLDLVRVWHPDRFHADSRLREKAEIRLAEINAAYRLLEQRKDMAVVSLPEPRVSRPGTAPRPCDSIQPVQRSAWTGRVSVTLAVLVIFGLIMAPRYSRRTAAVPAPAAKPVAPTPARVVAREAAPPRRPRTPAVVPATPSFIDREVDAILTGPGRTSR